MFITLTHKGHNIVSHFKIAVITKGCNVEIRKQNSTSIRFINCVQITLNMSDHCCNVSLDDIDNVRWEEESLHPTFGNLKVLVLGSVSVFSI